MVRHFVVIVVALGGWQNHRCADALRSGGPYYDNPLVARRRPVQEVPTTGHAGARWSSSSSSSSTRRGTTPRFFPPLCLSTTEPSSVSDGALTLPGRWRLNFNLPAANANVVVTARFLDDVGYEPPQGRVVFARGGGVEETVGRWTLSEDPDERKDGLWVWGLFAEPLYPFLLMTLPSAALGLPEGGALACRVQHKARPDDDAPLLSRGVVSVRRRETVGADLVGLSRATYNEDTALGTVVCSPLSTGTTSTDLGDAADADAATTGQAPGSPDSQIASPRTD